MERKENYFLYDKLNEKSKSQPSLAFKSFEKKNKIFSNDSISTRKTCKIINYYF